MNTTSTLARPRAVPQLLAGLDDGFDLAVKFAAGTILLVEVGLLLCSVIWRYLFHDPIVWSDELASMLFLWLVMFGAVLAARKGEHMRMTAFITRASPPRRELLDALAAVAALLFILLMIFPAYEYAKDEAIVTTPTLGISNAFRAGAMPVGLALMAVALVFRILRVPDFKVVAIALGIAAVSAVLLLVCRPLFPALGNYNLVIFFVFIFGACVFSGIPIAFSFGLAVLSYLAFATTTPVSVVIGRMDEGMSHMILLSVPLFVLLGLLTEMTGMAQAMIRFLVGLMGHVRGGLSYVLIAGMYLVSGISGSKAADIAAIAPVLVPEMKKRGADEGEIVAQLSATGAQTETVPPSLVLIAIASATGVSVAALFSAGILPSLMLGFMLCGLVAFQSRRLDTSRMAKAGWPEVRRSFWIALPALVLPLVIRSAVVEGVATATEVSTIGIAYVVLAGILIYRRFDLRRLMEILVDASTLSGAILLIIGTATAMAWGLTQSGFSASLAESMKGMPGGATSFLLLSLLIFVVLGSVLEGIPAVVLFGPLFFPIARQFGVHEVHYAMVVVLAMGVGLFTPPFGIGYYTACALSKINPDQGMRTIWRYMAVLMIGVFIIALFPSLSLYLVR